MRILSRYVLREYLVPLAYCLGGFISIYVLFELFGSFSRLAKANLPLGTAVRYFCAYLAPFFEWLAPAALMLAALYTMWNFCRHSEIIAMRANGVGFLTIVKPIVMTALVMGAVVWWVNDVYVPRNAQWARMMKTEQFDLERVMRSDDIVYRNPTSYRTWTIDHAIDDDARHLSNVRVAVEGPGGGTRVMNISAPQADYLDGEWWFRNATVQYYGAIGEETASPTPELDKLEYRTFPGFDEEPRDFLIQNRDWAYNSISDRYRYLRTHVDIAPETRRKYIYDIWSKILSPLAGLIITLFAIPAGIASGRQSVFRGILGALGMFFSFYALTIACMVISDRTWMPPIAAAVAPSAIFLVLGVRAFARNR